MQQRWLSWLVLVVLWNVFVFLKRRNANGDEETHQPLEVVVEPDPLQSELEHIRKNILPEVEAFASLALAHVPAHVRKMREVDHNRGSNAFEKQTIVLPIGPKDVDRFENLYKSMVKFFDFSDVEEWILVLPKRDSDYTRKIQALSHAHQDIIRILEDTEVVPDLGSLPTTYWMTQQIIKLAVAQFVHTTFFLVLDADLICFKPTSFRDLIYNNKALTNMYDSPHVVHHSAWWESSERVLNMTMDAPMYFGVTPCILATPVVHGVYKRLEALYKKPWSQYLLENVYTYSFTEYCIYAVFAVATDQFGKYHVPAINGIYHSEKSMWWESEFDAVDFGHMVKYADFYPGHFLVMQSNTKIEASRVKEKLGTLFD